MDSPADKVTWSAEPPGAVGTPWKDPLLLVLLAVTLACRLHLVCASAYIHDERFTWIPAAQRLSFQPGNLYLPVRDGPHPALTSYLTKAGILLFGENSFGFRFANLAAGLVSVLLVYRLGFQWSGIGTARWAAFLLALNEYHLTISSVVTEQGLHLNFVLLAMYSFTRFLQTERARWLFVAAASTGLGFLCSELAALLLPVFLLTLLALPHRRWLLRKEPWLAAALFFIVIAPDLWHHLCALGELPPYPYANYGDHLSRIGGVGFCEQPLVFYFRYAMEFAGIPFFNGFPEVPSVNIVFGATLFAGVLYAMLCKSRDPVATFLLVEFWAIFLLFTLMSPQKPTRQGVLLDPTVWAWIDATMLAAVLLTGNAMAELRGRRRIGAYIVAGALAIYVVLQVATLHIWDFKAP